MFIFSSCRPKGRCGMIDIDNYQGEGVESQLINYETTGVQKTAFAYIKVNGRVIYDKGEKKAIGVSVLIKDTKTKELIKGGVLSMDGTFSAYIPASKYDIEFQMYGWNPIILENASLKSGEIKVIDFALGGRGKELKECIVDLEKRN